MLRDHVKKLVESAVESMKVTGALPGDLNIPIEIADPKNPEHGDFATNFALIASKPTGLPPRAIADQLLAKLSEHVGFRSLEVAGPGFLNLRMEPSYIASYVPKILEMGPAELPKSVAANPLHMNIEFVSVNPNGPITIGSGRGAAFGDTLARVMEAAGHRVDREYYINDGVNSEQMRLFAESVKALANGLPVPDDGYKGEYVQDVANEVKKQIPAGEAPTTSWYQEQAQTAMIERQRSDLALFQVRFDTWFSEQSLHDSGKVTAALDLLKSRGAADTEPYSEQIIPEGKDRRVERKVEEPGTVWLRSTRFGDDKDRVLVRADGRPAYIAADVAYLQSKLGERKYDKSLLILGPDHHGYIGRMNAVCEALGFPSDRFEIVIFQIVRFMREGKPAPMRKRDGNIYELRDLILELGEAVAPGQTEEQKRQAGADVTRFFYLMRSPDTHMDFDIDLATKQSDENPVFYVQYAHARICSVLRKAEEEGFTHENYSWNLLTDPRELTLIKKILELPEEVRRCAVDYAVNRLTTYAVELARTFHTFYDGCRVVQKQEGELTRARVALCLAAKIGLQAALAMVGVSAPEKM